MNSSILQFHPIPLTLGIFVLHFPPSIFCFDLFQLGGINLSLVADNWRLFWQGVGGVATRPARGPGGTPQFSSAVLFISTILNETNSIQLLPLSKNNQSINNGHIDGRNSDSEFNQIEFN